MVFIMHIKLVSILVIFLFFKVWFQNRRAKFRKTERLSQHSNGSSKSGSSNNNIGNNNELGGMLQQT